MKIDQLLGANKYGDCFYLEFMVRGEIASLAKIFAALKQDKDEY